MHAGRLPVPRMAAPDLGPGKERDVPGGRSDRGCSRLRSLAQTSAQISECRNVCVGCPGDRHRCISAIWEGNALIAAIRAILGLRIRRVVTTSAGLVRLGGVLGSLPSSGGRGPPPNSVPVWNEIRTASAAFKSIPSVSGCSTIRTFCAQSPGRMPSDMPSRITRHIGRACRNSVWIRSTGRSLSFRLPCQDGTQDLLDRIAQKPTSPAQDEHHECGGRRHPRCPAVARACAPPSPRSARNLPIVDPALRMGRDRRICGCRRLLRPAAQIRHATGRPAGDGAFFAARRITKHILRADFTQPAPDCTGCSHAIEGTALLIALRLGGAKMAMSFIAGIFGMAGAIALPAVRVGSRMAEAVATALFGPAMATPNSLPDWIWRHHVTRASSCACRPWRLSLGSVVPVDPAPHRRSPTNRIPACPSCWE